MAPTKGLLFVTMQPHDSLPPSKFHDWYNNEHGPTRLRFNSIFANGFRYKANDGEKPEWLAIYDVHDMSEMVKEPYVSIRKPPVQSQRERDAMKEISVDRRFYDLVEEKSRGENFIKTVEVGNEGGESKLVVVRLAIHGGKKEELEKWYREEHMELLSKVPGWRRSRLFVNSTVDENPFGTEYVGVHDYDASNGLGGEEFKAAVSTPWHDRIFEEVVKRRYRRTYDLYYTFGPAPRDIANAAEEFTSHDGKTTTGNGVIQSCITTNDGVELSYKLEGNGDVRAPLIVLCNSILVDWGIWDTFITDFFSNEENKKYRILRFQNRGRTADCGQRAINMDVLASDVITLLDALRVKKAAAVIGVSMGGATALNVALKYPERISCFISCDTNSHAPESNRKAWGERIAISEKENAPGDIVGEQLAEATVRRWFVKESFDGGEKQKEVEKVKEMVKSNSLRGFKRSVEALFAYDMREEMKGSSVRGAFFVGSGDGILPDTMKTMAAGLKDSGEYVVIDGAGHLPMVEQPKAVAGEVTRFLVGN